jgi:hypothetical protein
MEKEHINGRMETLILANLRLINVKAKASTDG